MCRHNRSLGPHYCLSQRRKGAKNCNEKGRGVERLGSTCFSAFGFLAFVA